MLMLFHVWCCRVWKRIFLTVEKRFEIRQKILELLEWPEYEKAGR